MNLFSHLSDPYIKKPLELILKLLIRFISTKLTFISKPVYLKLCKLIERKIPIKGKILPMLYFPFG